MSRPRLKIGRSLRRADLALLFCALLIQEAVITSRVAGFDIEAVAIPRARRTASDRIRFERSQEWAEVRKQVLATHKLECVECGATDRLQVDHKKPKSKFPELALDIGNLQLLCWPCNRAKAAFV